MTHYEYRVHLLETDFSKETVERPPCNASHLTFGGRCLNCGYDPQIHGKQTKPRLVNDTFDLGGLE